MSLIQVPRFNRQLQRLLSILDEAPASQLAAEIVPVIVLDNDRPEGRYLGGEQLAWGRGSQGGGGVGTRSSVALQNPSLSGTIVVVHSIRVESPVASNDWELRVYHGEFLASPTIATRAWRDTRGSIAAGSLAGGIVAVIRGGIDLVDPAVIALIHQFRASTTANLFEFLKEPVVLAPNSGIQVRNAATNVSSNASFEWRERALEDLELR